MTYTFKGVFLRDPSLDLADMEALFHGHARRISHPFEGIGVSIEEWAAGKSNEEVKGEILWCSSLLGVPAIVYIDYASEDQLDHCGGFACSNGKSIPGSEVDIGDDSDGQAIVLLMAYLGVALKGSYFQPFTRGFFFDAEVA